MTPSRALCMLWSLGLVRQHCCILSIYAVFFFTTKMFAVLRTSIECLLGDEINEYCFFCGELYFFVFRDRVSLCNSPSFPTTHSETISGLKLTEIFLPLPPECWDYRCAPSPSSMIAVKCSAVCSVL